MRYWKCLTCLSLLITQVQESTEANSYPTCPNAACQVSNYQEISEYEFKCAASLNAPIVIPPSVRKVMSMTTVPALPNFYAIDTTWCENKLVDGCIKVPIVAWNIITRCTDEYEDITTELRPICATEYDTSVWDILNPDGTITTPFTEDIFVDIKDWLTFNKQLRIDDIRRAAEWEEEKRLEELAKQSPKNWRERMYAQGVEAKDKGLALSDNPHENNRSAYMLWQQGYMGTPFIPLGCAKLNTI